MQLLLGKTILSGPPEDLPTFRVTRRGPPDEQAGRRVEPYANQPAVTAIMQDYTLRNYSLARRSVRSTLNFLCLRDTVSNIRFGKNKNIF